MALIAVENKHVIYTLLLGVCRLIECKGSGRVLQRAVPTLRVLQIWRRGGKEQGPDAHRASDQDPPWPVRLVGGPVGPWGWPGVAPGQGRGRGRARRSPGPGPEPGPAFGRGRRGHSTGPQPVTPSKPQRGPMLNSLYTTLKAHKSLQPRR